MEKNNIKASKALKSPGLSLSKRSSSLPCNVSSKHEASLTKSGEVSANNMLSTRVNAAQTLDVAKVDVQGERSVSTSVEYAQNTSAGHVAACNLRRVSSSPTCVDAAQTQGAAKGGFRSSRSRSTSGGYAQSTSGGYATACHLQASSSSEASRRPRSIVELRKLTHDEMDELKDPTKLAGARRKFLKSKSTPSTDDVDALSMNELWHEIENCRYIRK